MSGIFTTDGSKSSFEPLPVGEYECAVTKTEVTKANSSGADMIKVELTVRDLPEQSQYKGRKFFNNLVFTPNAMPIVQGFMTAIGIPAGTNFDTYQDICTAIAYKPVRLKNKHQLYQGEQRDSVAYVMPTKYPMGEGESQGLAASAPPAFTVGGAPSSGDISDDDLPF